MHFAKTATVYTQTNLACLLNGAFQMESSDQSEQFAPFLKGKKAYQILNFLFQKQIYINKKKIQILLHSNTINTRGILRCKCGMLRSKHEFKRCKC